MDDLHRRHVDGQEHSRSCIVKMFGIDPFPVLFAMRFSDVSSVPCKAILVGMDHLVVESVEGVADDFDKVLERRIVQIRSLTLREC